MRSRSWHSRTSGLVSAAIVLTLAIAGAVSAGGKEPKQAQTEPAQAEPAQASPAASPKPAAPAPAIPELALHGYCPVSYRLAEADSPDGLRKAVRGEKNHQYVFAGRRYMLSSAHAKKLFEQDPTAYLPELDGCCLLSMSKSPRSRILGDPKCFMNLGGKIYLFESYERQTAFVANPRGVIEKARKNFEQPHNQGFCPVSYQTKNVAVKGDPKQKVAFHGYVHWMASPEAKRKFLENPARYVPQYMGHCTEAVSKHMLKPARPDLFTVFNGKTYLFASDSGKKEFDADPNKWIERADAAWFTLKDVN